MYSLLSPSYTISTYPHFIHPLVLSSAHQPSINPLYSIIVAFIISLSLAFEWMLFFLHSFKQWWFMKRNSLILLLAALIEHCSIELDAYGSVNWETFIPVLCREHETPLSPHIPGQPLNRQPIEDGWLDGTASFVSVLIRPVASP